MFTRFLASCSQHVFILLAEIDIDSSLRSITHISSEYIIAFLVFFCVYEIEIIFDTENEKHAAKGIH